MIQKSSAVLNPPPLRPASCWWSPAIPADPGQHSLARPRKSHLLPSILPPPVTPDEAAERRWWVELKKTTTTHTHTHTTSFHPPGLCNFRFTSRFKNSQSCCLKELQKEKEDTSTGLEPLVLQMAAGTKLLQSFSLPLSLFLSHPFLIFRYSHNSDLLI